MAHKTLRIGYLDLSYFPFIFLCDNLPNFFLDFVDQPRQKYFEEEEVSSGASVSSSRRPQQPPKPPIMAHAQVAQVIGRPLPQYPDYSRKVSNTASIHSIKPASHQLKKSSII